MISNWLNSITRDTRHPRSGRGSGSGAHALRSRSLERASHRFTRLIHNREAKSTETFDVVFASIDVEILLTAPQEPRMNADAESGSSAPSAANAATGSSSPDNATCTGC